jgi:hypothetical protein
MKNKDNPMQKETQFGELCPYCADEGVENFVDVPKNFQHNSTIKCIYGHTLVCKETDSDYVDVHLRREA